MNPLHGGAATGLKSMTDRHFNGCSVKRQVKKEPACNPAVIYNCRKMYQTLAAITKVEKHHRLVAKIV